MSRNQSKKYPYRVEASIDSAMRDWIFRESRMRRFSVSKFIRMCLEARMNALMGGTKHE